MDAEICGVLVGYATPQSIRIDGSIAGTHAAQAATHVTFTQETWEHIYRIKDRDFPDRAILGWYHSHPGFGVFLSEYDLFIHRNFFSAPHQIAWVFDPHSDEEGCFAWRREKVVRLESFTIIDRRQTVEASDTQQDSRDSDATARSWRDALRTFSTRVAGLLRWRNRSNPQPQSTSSSSPAPHGDKSVPAPPGTHQ